MIKSKKKAMKPPEGKRAPRADPYLMANVSPKRTGLPFVVWISMNPGGPHDVWVKVSRSPRVHHSESVTVAIRPDVRVVGGGKLSASDLSILRKWVELNRDVIIRHWDGDIEDTQDALDALKPLMSTVGD